MYNALKYTINSFQNLLFGLVGKTTGNGLTSKEEKKKQTTASIRLIKQRKQIKCVNGLKLSTVKTNH